MCGRVAKPHKVFLPIAAAADPRKVTMITLIARLLILKPPQTEAFTCNKRFSLSPSPQHMSIVGVLGSQKGHIQKDSRKLILKKDDTIGYQSVNLLANRIQKVVLVPTAYCTLLCFIVASRFLTAQPRQHKKRPQYL